MDTQLDKQEFEDTKKEDVKQEEKNDSEETSQEQINWKKFREQREEERKQKEEAEKRAQEKEKEAIALKNAMDALINNQKNPSKDDDYEDDDEEKRLQMIIEQKLAEREAQREKERQKKEQQEMPNKLNSTFSDFNKVCSSTNLDYLEYHYPEVAKAFSSMPDSFDKWSNVYHAVKKLVPNTESEKERKKVEENRKSPQSMSTAGKTPAGSDTAPAYLDTSRKKSNWERMQRIMKGC